MTLQAVLTESDWSDLNEVLQKEYVKGDDGRFHLDAPDMVTKKQMEQEVSGLRTNRDEILTEKKALQEKYQDVDLDKYKRGLEALNNPPKSGKSDQEVEDLIEARTSKMKEAHETTIKEFQTKIAERDKELAQLHDHLNRSEVERRVRSAFGDVASIRNERYWKHVMNDALGTFSLNGDGQLIAKNVQGETVYGKDGRVLTPEEWAASYVKENVDLFEQSKGGAANKDSRSKGGNAPVGTVSWNDVEGLSNNLDAIAKGEVTVSSGQ